MGAANPLVACSRLVVAWLTPSFPKRDNQDLEDLQPVLWMASSLKDLRGAPDEVSVRYWSRPGPRSEGRQAPHDELVHGAELSYSERVLKSDQAARKLVSSKRSLGVFRARRKSRVDYMSGEIWRELLKRVHP